MNSVTAAYALSQMTSSDSLLITAFKRGVTRSKSKSSLWTAELSFKMLERSFREAGRICKADIRSSARFWRPMSVRGRNYAALCSYLHHQFAATRPPKKIPHGPCTES